MLYILPRVVLQVKASLYYKTINNKQKKPKFHLFYPPPWLPCVLGMGEVGATGSRRGITSCPASPGPPAHGGCDFWFIDAKKLCQSPCPTWALARMAAGHPAWSRLDFGIASTLSTVLCLARLPWGWDGMGCAARSRGSAPRASSRIPLLGSGCWIQAGHGILQEVHHRPRHLLRGNVVDRVRGLQAILRDTQDHLIVEISTSKVLCNGQPTQAVAGVVEIPGSACKEILGC